MKTNMNPFIVGPPVPPSQFVGREYEVNQILSRLANPLNQGGSAIHGERRIGKTSLLHYISDPETLAPWLTLSPDHCRFIYLDGHSLIDLPETNALEGSFWSWVFDDLKEWLGDDLGDQASQLGESALKGSLTDRQLTVFFQNLGKDERLSVVLLDEFDTIIKKIDPANPRFFYRLRMLLNRPAPRGYSLVIASREPLYSYFQDTVWRGSEFYNNLAMLPLGPFTEGEVNELLDKYMEGTGADFDDDEREAIRRDSRGHPQKVQELAFDLFNRKKVFDWDDIIETWSRCKDTGLSANEKGRALEVAVGEIVSPVFLIVRDRFRSQTEEYDLILELNSEDPVWRDCGPWIPVEAKNWSQPVGQKEVSAFVQKVKLHGLRLAIFVSMAGFTGPAKDQSRMLNVQSGDLKLLLISGEEIDSLIADRRSPAEFFRSKLLTTIFGG